MAGDRVTIVRAHNLHAALADIMHAYGITRIRDQHVFIKPNMFRGAAVEESVVTDPALVRATVALCQDLRAHVEVGDNPVPNQGRTEVEIAGQCGFIDAAQNCFINIGQQSRNVDIGHGLLKKVYVSEAVLNCDVLISLPKFRVHELTIMTLAIKNQFGIIPGGLKPAIHARFPKIDDFCRVLIEVYEIRPPDLIIVDALTCIDARGRKYEPGILIGGTNGHAVDYACALVAGLDPWRVPTLRLARERGLFDPSSVTIAGDMPVLKGFRAPFMFPLRGRIVEFLLNGCTFYGCVGVPISVHRDAGIAVCANRCVRCTRFMMR